MDIRINLRKLDFYDAATKAIEYIASQLGGTKHAIPGLSDSSDEICEQISNEFIFGLINKSKSKLSSVEELQVTEVVTSFFMGQQNEATMFAVYKLLFYSISPRDVRMNLFKKVLSCAVSFLNKNFLELTAMWIQLHGCQSEIVLEIVTSLIKDHCFNGYMSATLVKLPTCSMLFTCHIITSITFIVSLPGQDENQLQLDAALLGVICDWIEHDPIVCLSSLFSRFSEFLQTNQRALWTSPTKPNYQTAVPGLIKWSTRSPFLRLPQDKLKVKLSDQDDSATSSNITPTTAANSGSGIPHLLWCRFHYLILKTIDAFPKVPGSNLFELVTMADMLKIIRVVVTVINSLQLKEVPRFFECSTDDGDDVINIVRLSLDRIAQVIAMGLSTGAFRSSLVDLKSILDMLPQTTFLSILYSHHMSNLPPTVLKTLNEKSKN